MPWLASGTAERALSTARATAVVRYLQDKAGIAPDHLIAAGYGEFRPIAANTYWRPREQPLQGGTGMSRPF